MWRGFGKCVGVIGLHLSYQNTEVRQLEAKWVLDWLAAHKKDCGNWLVMGDFNADSENKEIQILVEKELRSLVQEKKPTVGAFNPIRQIYGQDIPSRTIDWVFATKKVKGEATVVFDSAINQTWISDHAGIYVKLKH
jgi:endonuclease/exonuclease/phosphatase family metal-dependent hydrolase